MNAVQLQMITRKIDRINKRIEQLTIGEGISDIDRTVTQVRDLIELCKKMDGVEIEDNNRIYIAQVHLEKALEQLVHVSIIVHGGNRGTV